MTRGLDFETYCELDIKKVSLDTYVNHPSFRPLIATISFWRGDNNLDSYRYDFVTEDVNNQKDTFSDMVLNTIKGGLLVAHNSGFEKAVLEKMGLMVHYLKIRDSGVIARALGAGSSLDVAARQLLDMPKMVDGRWLVKKFCQPDDEGYVFIDNVENWTTQDWQDWRDFQQYCDVDSRLALQMETDYGHAITQTEWRNEGQTARMNERGWFVDMDVVDRMSVRYEENRKQILADFRTALDPKGELNLRSTPQLIKWCAERGIKAKSFDELHVEKMIRRIEDRRGKLSVLPPSDKRRDKGIPLTEVLSMLYTKQRLGGSSLSKLDTIKRLISEDGRLRHQYLHAGAGQTFRTSGYGVQMQNLKRLPPSPGDVSDMSGWTNEEMAQNLRQVFMAQDPNGRLIVGDFSSVESRGLAYLADASWKLNAYSRGRDMYKVLAEQIYGTAYERVSASERRTGKVGELSCGYGAGGKAVKDFAEKMGVDFTESEATQLVADWRGVNHDIVNFWQRMDHLLHEVVERKHPAAETLAGPNQQLVIRVECTRTPHSVLKQRPEAQTIKVMIRNDHDTILLTRWFQGCFMEGKDICYMKASELKSGPLWRERWTKKGQSGRYKLYGGKLTGILTQSFCRQIFFQSARSLYVALDGALNAFIMGQFHDELVVEWWPETSPLITQPGGPRLSLDEVIDKMYQSMSTTVGLSGFPLAAEVKSARRYTK